jgi:hypothetical protein
MQTTQPSFREGDSVICIDSSYGGGALKSGETYTVEGVCPATGGVWLKNISVKFKASRFKLNIPASIYIKIPQDEAQLGRIVQHMLFDAGFEWLASGRVIRDNISGFICVQLKCKQLTLVQNAQQPIYDPKTQLGEILRAFRTEPTTIDVRLNDAYYAKVTANEIQIIKQPDHLVAVRLQPICLEKLKVAYDWFVSHTKQACITVSEDSRGTLVKLLKAHGYTSPTPLIFSSASDTVILDVEAKKMGVHNGAGTNMLSFEHDTLLILRLLLDGYYKDAYTMPLDAGYTAIFEWAFVTGVRRPVIVVGCQRFECDVLDELQKAYNTITNKQ